MTEEFWFYHVIKGFYIPFRLIINGPNATRTFLNSTSFINGEKFCLSDPCNHSQCNHVHVHENISTKLLWRGCILLYLCHGVYHSCQRLYLEQHLCVSFACPNSMNLNSPFIWTTIKFQITCCAIVSGNPFSKFIKGISCWVAVLGTYQEIFFCEKWTKFRESASTLIRLKFEYKCAWVA